MSHSGTVYLPVGPEGDDWRKRAARHWKDSDFILERSAGMKRIRGSYFRQRPFLGNVVATLQRAGWIAALVILAALPSHAYSWYSGVSVGSTGTIYMGRDDITSYTMVHQAYVATKLTSPKGRQASHSEGNANAPNYYREDVQLPFDATDMGTYTETSTNEQGWCFACLMLGRKHGNGGPLYVPIPYAIAVLNTLVQGPAQCPAGMAGWSRTGDGTASRSTGCPSLSQWNHHGRSDLHRFTQ